MDGMVDWGFEGRASPSLHGRAWQAGSGRERLFFAGLLLFSSYWELLDESALRAGQAVSSTAHSII